MNGSVALPLHQPELSFVAAGGTRVRRTVHPSGFRVLTEQMPGSRSVTVGFWVAVGSRDEEKAGSEHPASLGSTHFLEHLLFKGTTTRSALDIAIAFDEVGGEHNALTAKEHTCYYAKVLDRDLPMAVSVLADMFTSSLIGETEFESERGVILEELAMAADDPSNVASEAFTEKVLAGHPLGRPIGGNPETINAATRSGVWDHYRANYRPQDLVVTAAGAVDHDELVAGLVAALHAARWELDREGVPVARRLPAAVDTAGHSGIGSVGDTDLTGLSAANLVSTGSFSGRVPPGAASPAAAASGSAVDSAASSASPLAVTVIERPLEQVNLILGMPGLIASDERRWTMTVLNSILGAGMSSRLFQKIREKRGLAYSVYSFAPAYSDAGIFGMYAGCAPQNAATVADLMRAELRGIAEHGVTEVEIRRANGQLAGASALALEDSDTRMSRLGRAELGIGEFNDLDETLRRIGLVSGAHIQELAAELSQRSFSLVAVGDIGRDAFHSG
ncbi:MAG: peptidase M16 [Candidatus Lumbricidophila eiseniae]|uniref:Peptidase M16 n=1 Tax=Candidatus Lumbricidiphila eiseniae TaxID=1969409 RepID=A0A2A6FPD8_9MICO|nr:MAG: peptidase M16 [Candidatus Lumbricidophila eiseniae]